MQVSGSGSPSGSPKVSPRQSPTSSLSEIRNSSPLRGGSEGGASLPVLTPSVATAFDAISFAALNLENVGLGGSGQGAEYTPVQLAKYNPENPRVSALKNSEKDSKKNPNRDSTGSVDSNSCLSPDMWDMKERLSRQPNPFRANHTLFNAPATPEVLKTASKVLRAREAGHAAEKQELRSDLVGLKLEISQLTSERMQLSQQSSALELQIADDKLLLAKQRLELESGSKELSKMEKKYTGTKAVLMAQAAALASEVESKQREKEALESTLLALNADKSFLETTHSSKIEALDGQYSKRHADLTKSVADLESELGSARLQIEKQAESVTEMSEKLRKSLEINKGLEANNKALVKANKGLVVKESKTASEAAQLRSELAYQNLVVARLMFSIQNPSQDISEFPTAKVEAEGAAEVAKSRSITFGQTPELHSKTKASDSLAGGGVLEVNLDVEALSPADALTTSEGAVVVKQDSPRHSPVRFSVAPNEAGPDLPQDSRVSVPVDPNEVLKKQRAEQVATDTRLAQQRKDARAAKRAAEAAEAAKNS